MTAPRALINPLLSSLGIDARQYWLLTKLFRTLSERREVLSQLGQEGATLRIMAWVYFGLSALMTLVAVMARPALASYWKLSLAFSGLLLFMILLSETANSLVNPVESLNLAHQPIKGATYTAAKLTHLLRIVAYFVLGLNAAPALAGLALDEAPWWFPLGYLPAAFAVGLVLALLACAIFGWLVRLVPPARLKSVSQMANMAPYLLMLLFQYSQRLWKNTHPESWLPNAPWVRTSLEIACAAAILTAIIGGLHALSGDYLIKVSTMLQGRSGAHHATPKRAWFGALVGRYAGPPARGGFAYLKQMLPRDWQLRRQLVPLIPSLLPAFVFVIRDWRTSPFAGKFTAVHMVPHAIGICLFFLCTLLSYGSDFKGAWVFQLVPGNIFPRFVRGIHAALWVGFVLFPHLVLLPLLCWSWGTWQGTLFVAFSAALASTYLALNLRLVEGVPFGAQVEASRGAGLLPIMLLGGVVIGISVAVQHFVLFHSPATVLASAVALAAMALWLTRKALQAFADSIRYRLSQQSNEAGRLYIEL